MQPLIALNCSASCTSFLDLPQVHVEEITLLITHRHRPYSLLTILTYIQTILGAPGDLLLLRTGKSF